jgi:hypothetical protein
MKYAFEASSSYHGTGRKRHLKYYGPFADKVTAQVALMFHYNHNEGCINPAGRSVPFVQTFEDAEWDFVLRDPVETLGVEKLTVVRPNSGRYVLPWHRVLEVAELVKTSARERAFWGIRN